VRAATSLFRLLADQSRLRLLRVLAQDRFNVGELTAILALAQSGVSRHLGLLRSAGLVVEQREAGFVYYRLAAADGSDERASLWTLLSAQFAGSGADRQVREDEARLQEVLRHRKENFDTPGDSRQLVPGRSWAAWARALGHLLPAIEVADIGCGDGYLTLEVARWARHVIGVDRSDDRLESAKALAGRRRVGNVTWKKGDLTRLPLRDESIDLAIVSQALRYATDPERALVESARVIRGGGRILLLDLNQHDQVWVRSRFGDQRLGFTAAEFESLLQGAGFKGVRLSVGTRKAGDPFSVLIASAQKPSDSRAHAARTAPPGRNRW
jgi:ArsR family transcriptional regulator